MKVERAQFTFTENDQATESSLDWFLTLCRAQLKSIGAEIESLLAGIERLETNCKERPGGCVDLAKEVGRFEVTLIQIALNETHGHQRKAAALLQINPTTLNAKMKKYAIHYTERQSRKRPTPVPQRG